VLPYMIAIGTNDDSSIDGPSWYTRGLGWDRIRGCYALQFSPNRVRRSNEHPPMGFKATGELTSLPWRSAGLESFAIVSTVD
jgi:hypothetical protein